jgi:AcrR family transcriptional regulator
VRDDLGAAASAQADSIVRRFFGPDGRLTTIPAKQSRQLALYDLIAQRFTPGVRYTELEVNRELLQLYDDYVTLRRGLVDFGLLDRADGRYWRSGGTVPVHPPPAPAPAMSVSARGAARREAILTSAAELFADNGYASVGMDDIGAAAGVTGPAIYRHFGSKAEVLTAVFDRIIEAVTREPEQAGATDARVAGSFASTDPGAAAGGRLAAVVLRYADVVAHRRRLMAVFIREVHHLPPEQRERLRRRQRELVGRWRALLAAAHPEWSTERVRTAVHAAFGLLNTVGTFDSALSDADLARELTDLACGALRLPTTAAGTA